MENNEKREPGILNVVVELFENIKGYIQTYFDILKLDVWDATTNIFSSLIFILTAIFTLFFALIVIEIALALYIGELNGHLWVGLLWIGFGNLLIVPFLYVLHRNGAIHNLVKTIIQNALKDDHRSVGK